MNLKVDDMDFRCPGISEGINITFREAIKVCLEINKHPQGKLFVIEGDVTNEFNIVWEAANGLHKAWRDYQDTTEVAATGIAVHIILNHTDYTVIERSWKGTAFDYWLGKKSETDHSLFQNLAKLEVSGILKENEKNKLESRVNKKIEQVEKFKHKYPVAVAYIIIVEFSLPKSQVQLTK
jgi:hypothetical protein